MADHDVVDMLETLLAALNAPFGDLPLEPFPIVQGTIVDPCDPEEPIVVDVGERAQSFDQEFWRTTKRWNFGEVYDTFLEYEMDVELTWRSLREQARNLDRLALKNGWNYTDGLVSKIEENGEAEASAGEMQGEDANAKEVAKPKGRKKPAPKKPAGPKKPATPRKRKVAAPRKAAVSKKPAAPRKRKVAAARQMKVDVPTKRKTTSRKRKLSEQEDDEEQEEIEQAEIEKDQEYWGYLGVTARDDLHIFGDIDDDDESDGDNAYAYSGGGELTAVQSAGKRAILRPTSRIPVRHAEEDDEAPKGYSGRQLRSLKQNIKPAVKVQTRMSIQNGKITYQREQESVDYEPPDLTEAQKESTAQVRGKRTLFMAGLEDQTNNKKRAKKRVAQGILKSSRKGQ